MIRSQIRFFLIAFVISLIIQPILIVLVAFSDELKARELIYGFYIFPSIIMMSLVHQLVGEAALEAGIWPFLIISVILYSLIISSFLLAINLLRKLVFGYKTTN